MRDITVLCQPTPFAALEWLDIDCQTHVQCLVPLAVCSALKRLGISGCKGITDLSPLSTNTALTWLNLHGSRVTELGPLRSFGGQLAYLCIRHSVVSFEPLSACTSLVVLDLSGANTDYDLSNYGEDGLLPRPLQPLTALSALECLDLSNCYDVQWEGIGMFAQLPVLKKLILLGQPTNDAMRYDLDTNAFDPRVHIVMDDDAGFGAAESSGGSLVGSAASSEDGEIDTDED